MEKGVTYGNAFSPLANEVEDEKGGEDRDGHSSSPHPRRGNIDEEGFQQVRRRKSKNNYHPFPPRQNTKFKDLTSLATGESKERVVVPCLDIGSSSGWGYLKNWGEDIDTQKMMETSKPRFYKMLPDGAFDTDVFEEDGEMDEDGETEEDDTGGQDTAFLPDPT